MQNHTVMLSWIPTDPEAASKEFLADMQKSDNHTQDAFDARQEG